MTPPDSGRQGRPAAGPGHYLRDLVYGANDGVITTFAIVASVSGASLSAAVALVLGVANLVADGLSMGASNYLSLKTDLEQRGASVAAEQPWRHGAATFLAFVGAGSVPLFAYFVGPMARLPVFPVACALAAVALATIGAMRALFVRKAPWLASLEMLTVGGLAATAAFAVGFFARAWIG